MSAVSQVPLGLHKRMCKCRLNEGLRKSQVCPKEGGPWEGAKAAGGNEVNLVLG